MKFDKDLVDEVARAILREIDLQGIPYEFDGDPFEDGLTIMNHEGEWYWNLDNLAKAVLKTVASNYGKT